MAKHTQAHLSRKVPKSQSKGGLTAMAKRKIEYYMGAKLEEIGVNINLPIYRWKGEDKGNYIEWTYSAYWDDSKDQILAEEAKATGESRASTAT